MSNERHERIKRISFARCLWKRRIEGSEGNVGGLRVHRRDVGRTIRNEKESTQGGGKEGKGMRGTRKPRERARRERGKHTDTHVCACFYEMGRAQHIYFPPCDSSFLFLTGRHTPYVARANPPDINLSGQTCIWAWFGQAWNGGAVQNLFK